MISTTHTTKKMKLDADMPICFSKIQETEGIEDELELKDFLEQKGYRFVRKLADSLQGQVFLAKSVQSPMSRFAIKRVHKNLCEQRMTFVDEDGMREFVDEDILSEAAILQRLTVHNDFAHVAKFIEFFENTDYFFLVTEFIDGLTLGEFTERAHELIRSGKLSGKKWLRTVKFLMWQMTAAVNWLHSVYGCCHLDLCADNVMLEHAEFETQSDGSVLVSRDIEVKFIDFGVAEQFARSGSFSCTKSQISIDNGAYVAPEVFDGGAVYDARKADTWALGILMYRLVTNAAPFLAEDIWDEARNGYAALKNDNFVKWLRDNELVPMLSKNGIAMLASLLHFEADHRPFASQAVKAKWFNAYWKANGAKISRAMKNQNVKE